ICGIAFEPLAQCGRSRRRIREFWKRASVLETHPGPLPFRLGIGQLIELPPQVRGDLKGSHRAESMPIPTETEREIHVTEPIPPNALFEWIPKPRKSAACSHATVRRAADARRSHAGTPARLASARRALLKHR